MAALASAGSFDEPLLWRDFQRYRRYAEQLCARSEPVWRPAETGESASGGGGITRVA